MDGWATTRGGLGLPGLNVGGRGRREPKSGTFKSTMETIYPRLSRSCNGPFTPRSVPWLGQESGWQGVGIRLIDAISRVGVCARASGLFRLENGTLVLRSSFLSSLSLFLSLRLILSGGMLIKLHDV